MAAMERDEVMKLVRDHLSTELEVAPERIQPETRFREDLDAGIVEDRSRRQLEAGQGADAVAQVHRSQ